MAADAGELYRRGVDLVNRGRFADARRTLRLAAAAADEIGDTDLGARIVGTTAYLIAELSDGAEAERMCVEALERPGLSQETVSILHGQLGSIAMERGRLDDAAEWLGRSIRGLESDPVRSANMRMNRSLVNMRRGDLDAAVDDLLLAERAYRDAGMPLDADQAVHNRGYVAMLAGDLVSALRTMQSVRAPLDEASELWSAVNELDRAEVLRDAGLTTEAERSLEHVIGIFGRHRVAQERAEAEYQLARSLLNHAPERASIVAGASSRRFRRLGSDEWALRAEAIRLRARLAVVRVGRAGLEVSASRRLPSAALVESVAVALDGAGYAGEAAALRVADELARVHRGTARAVVRDAAPWRSAPLDVVLLTHELRAERARLAGREVDVRRHAARGIDVLERTRRAVGSLDLQAAAGMQGAGLTAMGLASALRSMRPDVVFAWSERARLTSQQVVPVRPPPDPELALELAELRRIRAEGDPDWLEQPRAAVLRDRARERQWSQTAAGGRHRRVDLAALRAGLADGDALFAFVFDGARLAGLTVTPRRATVVGLDWKSVRAAFAGLRADLDVAASVRSGPMVGVVRAGLADRLATLSALLLDPLVAVTDPARIVLTAPGVLAGVPWSMLPVMRGRSFTVSSSASRWAAERSTARVRPTAAGFAAGPRVARANEEVGLAASPWKEATVLRTGDASVSAVTRLAHEVDVLHVAAHGRHAVDNPLFSGLDLADGTLFGYDIDLIQNVPTTVVLSACEVGRSSVRWGEEAIGMTRVWLHAGARCVIASPVVVADDDACELLSAVHAGLARGEAPAEALATASARTGVVAPFQAYGTGF